MLAGDLMSRNYTFLDSPSLDVRALKFVKYSRGKLDSSRGSVGERVCTLVQKVIKRSGDPACDFDGS